MEIEIQLCLEGSEHCASRMNENMSMST